MIIAKPQRDGDNRKGKACRTLGTREKNAGRCIENSSSPFRASMNARDVGNSHESGPTGHTDGSLIRGIREGNDDAAEELFLRYIQRVSVLSKREFGKAAGGRVDTEDLTQSVFRTLFRRLRDGQYDVPPGDSIWRLLAVITLNKVRAVGAFHRASKRDVRKTQSCIQATLGEDPQTEDGESEAILRLTISEMLLEFPEVNRTIIELRMENHDVASIAHQVGRTKRTVERVLKGFREKLRLNYETAE